MNTNSWTQLQRDALKTIADSRHGQVFAEALRSELEAVQKALVMQDNPEQVRRLQGEARALISLTTLLSPSPPNTASKG